MSSLTEFESNPRYLTPSRLADAESALRYWIARGILSEDAGDTLLAAVRTASALPETLDALEAEYEAKENAVERLERTVEDLRIESANMGALLAQWQARAAELAERLAVLEAQAGS